MKKGDTLSLKKKIPTPLHIMVEPRQHCTYSGLLLEASVELAGSKIFRTSTILLKYFSVRRSSSRRSCSSRCTPGKRSALAEVSFTWSFCKAIDILNGDTSDMWIMFFLDHM